MKSYLLDTHVLLWAAGSPTKLPKKVQRCLGDEANTFYVSSASLWEMAIKLSLGKLKLPLELGEFVEQCVSELGIRVVGFGPDDLDVLVHLPFHHRDPFDRLLIAQAQTLGAFLMSKDKEFDRYDHVRRFWNE